MGRPNKGQHKMPSTYLEAFSDVNGFVWVLNRDLKVFSQKPDEVLREKDFYTIRFPDGGGTLDVETKLLGTIEGAFADIYRRKLSRFAPLEKREKAIMAAFIASMMERSPGSRVALTKFLDDVNRMTAQMMAMPDEKKKKMVRFSASLGGGQSIPASVFLEVSKDVGSLHSSMIGAGINFVAPIIYDMKWTFMMVPEGDFFITSDNPCVATNPADHFWPGLGMEDIEVSLPLSPSLAVLCGWKIKKDGMYISVDKDTVSEINRRTRRYGDSLLSNQRRY